MFAITGLAARGMRHAGRQVAYALGALFGYLIHGGGLTIGGLLKTYYSTPLHHRIVGLMARSGIDIMAWSVLMLCLSVATVVVPAFLPGQQALALPLLGVIPLVLTPVVPQRHSAFILRLDRARVMRLHLSPGRSDNDTGTSRQAQLRQVAKLVAACRVARLELDSPLLVDPSLQALLLTKLARFFAEQGVAMSATVEAPRELSPAITGGMAPYRKAYAALRAGRVQWASDHALLSRRITLELQQAR